MMPVIRISDATWERLKRYARPLEDTAEDVVRMALDALDGAKQQPITTPRAPAVAARPARKAPVTAESQKLPQTEFRAPLLEVLRELGGRASVKDIRERLEPKIAHRLSDADYREVSSGDPRWWNAACWERNEMVKVGLLRQDSQRGVWELTERGKAAATPANTPLTGKPFDLSTATWRDDVERALDLLDGGEGVGLAEIYREVRRLRMNAGRSIPDTLEATIRRTLEDHSSDSDNYRGIDVFYMPQGKGAGVWGLRRKRVAR